ncbi:MAG TPA: polyribonucleotide nucleotidyltransferase [Candidatus Limnocylindria bacterium]|nr:polyribonucleotide nucleotidyltransferase [Candidatus Limnocylindria bacterium]
MQQRIEVDFHGRTLTIETGRMAKQAGGAALIQYGESVVLVTATAMRTAREGIDFFPLTCDYVEKTFAAGKIPGGFFKREGRPAEKEVLTSRLMDRPIRPLFPKGFNCETQVIATVLSHDKENDPDMLAMLGASTALTLSDIPFLGPIAAVRIGRVKGSFVINPTTAQLGESDMNIIVAGSRDAIVMVEGGAHGVPEAEVLDALYTAHAALQPLIDLQEKLQKVAGKPKREVAPPAVDAALEAAVRETALPKLHDALAKTGKQERYAALDAVTAETVAALAADDPVRAKQVSTLVDKLKKQVFREAIVKDRRRIDGRGLEDVRPITCEVGVLPRTHGSALFTRGETQALVVTTLGTSSDEQRIDALVGEQYKKFMLHYNFPPFSTGEVKFLRSPGRREIGHGALAERAVAWVLPPEDKFPYTIRIVSEVLESNGSSSMATVCGASLSVMDAGVPVEAAVAGVAMGLIREGDEVRVLSDILGDEDHLGDMDFKVAGTASGVTALQMDIKIAGVTREVMAQALEQARAARLHILNIMNAAIAEPRKELSMHAPRIVTIKINPDRIRDLIGPGGKTIRGIVDETGCKIDVEDDGTVLVASSDGEAMQRAIDRIRGLTAEAEVGRIYRGTVRRVVDFGAFVEILPGTDGLVHISQLAPERVRQVTDVVREGDVIDVKVLEIDKSGKIRLSRKEALREAGASH